MVVKLLSNVIKGARKDLASRRAVKNVQRFLLFFLASFALFSFVIIPLTAPPWYGVGVFSAQGAGWLLGSFGIENDVRDNVIAADVGGTRYDFVVSQLCSGDIEIALLVSLLLASFDVFLSWRIVGSVVGIAGIVIINPVRIAITLGVTKNVGVGAGDIAHSVIFRVFLFIFLVFYYFVWYRLCKGRAPFKPSYLKLWKWKRGS